MTRFICLGLLLGLSILVHGQSPSRKAAVLLSATVTEAPASVNLSWPSHTGATAYQVFRRSLGATSWGNPIATLSGAAQGFSDQQVQIETPYEYKVYREGNGLAYGFLRSGIRVPAASMHSRGKIIVLVEAALHTQIQSELDQLELDLIGDGWFPIRLTANASDSPMQVRNAIIGVYNNDPGQVHTLYIIGNVPVPYSGYIAPDGHGSHQGAWACDGYYGDMDGSWSDSYVWTTNANTPWNHNVPGDGKFDQSDFASKLELAVGRVFLGDLPAFPQNEVQLTKNYLNKAHAFKMKQWEPSNQSAVFDNLSYISGGSMASTGYQAAAAMVGFSNVADILPGNQAALQSFNTNDYLFSYRSGNGTQGTYQNTVTFVGINNLNLTNDVVANGNGTAFNMSFGSYFGDWDNPNNYLRALIAKGNGLTSVWSGIPNWYMHPMAMGEPVGTCARISMNNTEANYTKQNGGWQGPNMSRVQMGLMGDPSLRMRMVAPPSNLSAAATGFDMSFSWNPSPESVSGYYIYRINDITEKVELISPLVAGNSFTVSSLTYVPGQRFMVRAAHTRTTASGSYVDLSIGAVATVTGVLLPDCAGNIGGVAYPGSPCNDGNNSTVNDAYNAACYCEGELPNLSTACFLLGGGNDPDMEESNNGGIYANSDALDLVLDSELPWNWRGNQTTGLHFINVSIPQGATIIDAHIQFTVNGVSNYNPALISIAAEDANDAPEFDYNGFNISSRTLTQNTVSWAPNNWNVVGESGMNQRSPNLNAILQELVNKPGWNENNAVNFILSGIGGRQAFSWNQDASKAARLCVSFQEANTQPVDCNGVVGGSALPGSACDDGNDNTINDVFNSDCDCVGTLSPPAGTDNCIVVSSSTNPDVEESDAGNVYTSAGAFDLVYDSELPWNWRGNQTAGLFFENLSIPQGATIESAYIQFTAQGTTNYDPIALNITVENSTTPLPFGYQVNDLSARSVLADSVQWSPGLWNTVGEQGNNQKTPDLSGLIQTLVNRSDWTTTNNLAIIISGYGGRQAFSSEQDLSKAPKLCITFNEDNAGLPIDCLGVPGGTAVLDDCGICNGTNDCLSANQFSCFSITGSEDNDQEESSSGGVYSNSGALDLVFDSELPWNWRGNQTVGLRFVDLGIPNGATITNASILFTAFDTVNYNPCEIGIAAEASDDAAPFSWSAFDISSRTSTNALIGWNPANWSVLNAAGGSQTSPNIAPVVQEVIDRPGWVEGNALLIVMNGTGGRQAYSSNQEPTAAPKLCIEWKGPSAVAQRKQAIVPRNSFKLFPNPNNGSAMTVEFANEFAEPVFTALRIYDVSGKLVWTHDLLFDVGVNQRLITFDRQLAKGAYQISLQSDQISIAKQLIID